MCQGQPLDQQDLEFELEKQRFWDTTWYNWAMIISWIRRCWHWPSGHFQSIPTPCESAWSCLLRTTAGKRSLGPRVEQVLYRFTCFIIMLSTTVCDFYVFSEPASNKKVARDPSREGKTTSLYKAANSKMHQIRCETIRSQQFTLFTGPRSKKTIFENFIRKRRSWRWNGVDIMRAWVTHSDSSNFLKSGKMTFEKLWGTQWAPWVSPEVRVADESKLRSLVTWHR